MGQEFFINSELLQQKIKELLPSQGGLGAGQDLSASTQIIPVVDLTETAEGSTLREDLQRSLSHDTSTTFSVTNSTSTLLNTTGYYRIFGNAIISFTSGAFDMDISIDDGVTSKKIFNVDPANPGTGVGPFISPFDFTIKVDPGDTVTATSGNSQVTLCGLTRQIASIDGTLINP